MYDVSVARAFVYDVSGNCQNEGNVINFLNLTCIVLSYYKTVIVWLLWVSIFTDLNFTILTSTLRSISTFFRLINIDIDLTEAIDNIWFCMNTLHVVFWHFICLLSELAQCPAKWKQPSAGVILQVNHLKHTELLNLILIWKLFFWFIHDIIRNTICVKLSLFRVISHWKVYW